MSDEPALSPAAFGLFWKSRSGAKRTRTRLSWLG
jgi:hypothetical protein